MWLRFNQIKSNQIKSNQIKSNQINNKSIHLPCDARLSPLTEILTGVSVPLPHDIVGIEESVPFLGVLQGLAGKLLSESESSLLLGNSVTVIFPRNADSSLLENGLLRKYITINYTLAGAFDVGTYALGLKSILTSSRT